MDKAVRSIVAVFFAALGLLAGAAAFAQEKASPADTARFLAGLPPSETSPLAPLAREAGWLQHAKTFDAAWRGLDQRQLSKIRAWAGQRLTSPRPVLFYFFSGPDFLYADAFFSRATTYVLAGLEPVGDVPNIQALAPRAIPSELGQLRGSLNSVLQLSFFITEKMKADLKSARLGGALPILYVFMARAGHAVDGVTLVALGKDGALENPDAPAAKGLPRGAKVMFTGADGEQRTLYYFSTDLSNHGVERSGFLAFCERLGAGDSLFKSASYLMHSDNFSKARDFVLKNAAAIVQDDSGIPLRHFKAAEWDLHPFGNYLGPIGLFAKRSQPGMRDLFKKGRSTPLDFGIGYRWRPRESNLLLAIKNAGGGPQAGSGANRASGAP